MTMRHRLIRGSARRGLAMLSAAAMLTSMLAVPAFAEHYEDATVLEGDTAIEAALAWSGLFDSSDAVAIGRNDVFADNLSSGLIQGLGDGVPLLLTDTDELAQSVADEIVRLGAQGAHVLGGEAAISADVEQELEDLGLTIHRHAGATRIETAIDIASKHATDATSAILARSTASGTDESQAFADSLAAGAWAAESGMPILLTQSNELNDNLAAYLDGSSITDISIVGGTAAVSAAVAAELESMGITVDRVSGATRFETAVAVAEARGFNDASDATDGVIVVEGQDADSWAAGFAAAAFASNPKPIVLANGDDLPAPTEAFLAGAGVPLFCGPLLAAAACDAAAEELGLEQASHATTFTGAPELLSAEVVNSTETERSVRFVFDEEVISTPIIGSTFYVYPPNTNERVASTKAQRDSANTSAVLAVFPLTGANGDRVRDAIRAGVARGSVQDAAGKTNPDSSVALGALSQGAGITRAPDLVSVTNVDATNETADFTFDQAVTVSGSFELALNLDADASKVTSISATILANTDSKVVRVTFGGFDAGKVARGIALQGAVTAASGATSPLQAADVSGNTEAPDLLSVTLDAANNTALFAFDENVDSLDDAGNRTFFRLYYLDGTTSEASTQATDRIDTRTVKAYFPAGTVNDYVAGGSVLQGAVARDTVTTRVNLADEEGRATSFAAGDTLAPQLVSAAKENVTDVLGNITGRRITYTFDQAVSSTVNAANFRIVNEAGDERAVAGTCTRVATSTSQVRCELTATAGTDFDAMGNAKLATVANNAVTQNADVRIGGGAVTLPNPEGAANL